MTDSSVTSEGQKLPRVAIALGLGILVLVVLYFGTGMPGMDHGSPPGDPVGYELAEPAAFAALLADTSAFVVNVHVPFEGEIAGTDERIASDRLASSGALPDGRGSTILLYCKTGSMSADAADSLVNAGYTNITVLRGGMDAWEAAGRPLDGAD